MYYPSEKSIPKPCDVCARLAEFEKRPGSRVVYSCGELWPDKRQPCPHYQEMRKEATPCPAQS